MSDSEQNISGTGSTFVEPGAFVDRHAIHPVLFAFVCLLAVFILYQVGGAVITLLAAGSSQISRGNVTLIRTLTFFSQVMLIFIPTMAFARLLTTRMRDVFLFRVPTWREGLFGLLALLALQRVFEAYLFFQDLFPLPETIRHLVAPLKKMIEEMVRTLVKAESVPELLYVIVVIAVVPAVVEELLFRGLVQKTFERAVRPLTAALVTGTIFGLYHLNPFEAVPLVGLGCFLGFLRYRSKSLLVPMAAHFVNNAMAVTAVYFGLENDNLLVAANVGNQTFVSMLVQLLLFGALFILIMMSYIRSTEMLHADVTAS